MGIESPTKWPWQVPAVLLATKPPFDEVDYDFQAVLAVVDATAAASVEVGVVLGEIVGVAED